LKESSKSIFSFPVCWKYPFI